MSISRDIEISAEKLVSPVINSKVKNVRYKMSSAGTSVEILFANGMTLIIKGAKFSHIELEMKGKP